jgi:hypothetical protein
MRARALKWVRFQQCRWASLGGRRPGGEGVGERGVPRNPAEAEAHRVGGSAGGEAWRRGESDAAQPAAEVGRDRARSHLARGGGRCQRGPGGLGPGAARGCRCRFDTRGGVDKLPFILFFETRHDAGATGEGAADFTGGLPTLRGGGSARGPWPRRYGFETSVARRRDPLKNLRKRDNAAVAGDEARQESREVIERAAAGGSETIATAECGSNPLG